MKRFIGGARGRLLSVVAFLVLAFGCFTYLFTGTASWIPFVQPTQWEAVVYLDDADNLVKAGRVQIAGVQVGKVRDVYRENGKAKAVFDVDEKYAPLHQGLKVRLGARSLVEDNYLDITDGTGPPLPDGAVIPAEAVVPSVQVRDVLASLDDRTRAQTGSFLRTIGPATQGTDPDIARTFEGLGKLGSQGNSALDALAAQSADIRSLGANLTTVLRSLNTSQGQIATLVSGAQRLTAATTDKQEALGQTFQRLPGVLQSATDATGSVNELSGALDPVAKDLKEAAPPLTAALEELPATSKDLRGLLPALDKTLGRAPATLDRVPRFGEDVRDLVPPTQEIVRDLNPLLRYVSPYGDEIGVFLANFNSVLSYTDERGANYIRLRPIVNAPYSVQSPVMFPGVLGQYIAPFPPNAKSNVPGPSNRPAPYTGPYPRIERLPK